MCSLFYLIYIQRRFYMKTEETFDFYWDKSPHFLSRDSVSLMNPNLELVPQRRGLKAEGSV